MTRAPGTDRLVYGHVEPDPPVGVGEGVEGTIEDELPPTVTGVEGDAGAEGVAGVEAPPPPEDPLPEPPEVNVATDGPGKL